MRALRVSLVAGVVRRARCCREQPCRTRAGGGTMKSLAGVLIGVFTCAFGWQIATWYAASRLAPSSLGDRLWTLRGHAMYAPWKWWVWKQAFGHQSPSFFGVSSRIAYGSLAIGALLPGLVARHRQRTAQSTAHGSARWAVTAELRDVGLGTSGVVLCQTEDAQFRATLDGDVVRWNLEQSGELVCDNSDAHVLCFAPTGSGKGAGLVVPTLLSWVHSTVVYDPKGELYALTAGWRRSFSHVIRFEPTSVNSAQYNPLFAVPRGEGDVREAQNIAEVLVPKDDRGVRDHWRLTAYTLLVGTILHVLYAEEKKDLRGVLELLTDPERPIREVLAAMMATPHLGDRPHPQVVSAARAALNKSDNELSGVVSTAETCLGLWLDPIVARNTSRSDFCAAQMNGLVHPVSLYLIVPTRDIERLRPLIRLMIVQIGNLLTAELDVPSAQAASASSIGQLSLGRRLLRALQDPLAPLEVDSEADPNRKQRLLFMLDEFPTLGYLPWVESAIAYLRGYRIKLFLIAQSLNQLERIYGPNHAFIDNSWARVTYTGFDDRTARRISDLLGQRTEVQRRESVSKKRGALFSESVTQSQQEHGRPLLTAGEILTLPYEDAIVFAGGVAPYRGKKIMYYLDSRFAGRASLPTPDSAAEQAAELPRPLPASEWSSLRPLPRVRISSTAKHKNAGALAPEFSDELQNLVAHDDADGGMPEHFEVDPFSGDGDAEEMPL